MEFHFNNFRSYVCHRIVILTMSILCFGPSQSSPVLSLKLQMVLFRSIKITSPNVSFKNHQVMFSNFPMFVLASRKTLDLSSTWLFRSANDIIALQYCDVMPARAITPKSQVNKQHTL